METSNIVVESRLIKASDSFTPLKSASFAENTCEKPIDRSCNEERWNEVNAPMSANWDSTLFEEGYNTENILLYLIDMTILSGEQIRWKRIIEHLDFSSDIGPVEDFVVDQSDQPSTSSSRHIGSNDETEVEHELQDADSSETIVKALMDYFKNKRQENSEHLMRVPYLDVPENLLEMYNQLPDPPNDYFIVDGQCIRLRSSIGWIPPKKTFIYDLPEFQQDITTLLCLQGNSCAGCGVKFQKRRPNLCFYFNKLFCKLCFQGQTTLIPARILHKWDFREYPVSDVAYKFLSVNENQPVFDIHVINQSLFRKVKNLRTIRLIRLKISHLWQYIKRCPHSEKVVTKHGILRTMYESIPSRFLSIEFSCMYSILDFVSIENGNLIEMLSPLECFGASHVTKCNICQQRGFLCQICVWPSQIIFPFQLEKIFRCEACGSLSHLACYKKQMRKNNVWVCGRCERIRRKRLVHQKPLESSNSD